MMIEIPAATKTDARPARSLRWALMLGALAWAVFVVAPSAADEAVLFPTDTEINLADDPGEADLEATEAADDESTAENSAEIEPDDEDEEDLQPATQPADAGKYLIRKYEKEGFFKFIWNFFTNIREFLEKILGGLGSWAYLILWSILFMETGLIVMAFLPGDSLLFATGTLASWGGVAGRPLDLYILLPILVLGPIMGDSCNYWIGRLYGRHIMGREKTRFVKKTHLEKAHAFYARHGGKAVAIGRFLPLIRTFVPFVAGAGKMGYGRFLSFSVVGSILWIHVCVLAGWGFGQVQFVKDHFETIIIAIVLITLMPALITFLRSRRAAKAQAAAAKEDNAERP